MILVNKQPQTLKKDSILVKFIQQNSEFKSLILTSTLLKCFLLYLIFIFWNRVCKIIFLKITKKLVPVTLPTEGRLIGARQMRKKDESKFFTLPFHTFWFFKDWKVWFIQKIKQKLKNIKLIFAELSREIAETHSLWSLKQESLFPVANQILSYLQHKCFSCLDPLLHALCHSLDFFNYTTAKHNLGHPATAIRIILFS